LCREIGGNPGKVRVRVSRSSGVASKMNKFNLPRRNIQQERRAKRSDKRRVQSRDSNNKITLKPPARAPSGKKARKLEKKWRQAQKEAIQSGLVTMHDIEMMAVDGGGDNQESSEEKAPKTGRVFHMKRRTKIRAKVSSKKGKQVSEHLPTPSAEAEGDVMVQ
jgi:hypothetical protein